MRIVGRLNQRQKDSIKKNVLFNYRIQKDVITNLRK